MIPNTHIKDRVIHTSLIILILLFIVGIGLITLIIYKEKQLTDRMYPNIYIDSINVGAMKKNEVKTLFNKNTSGLEKVKLNVQYKEEQIATLSAETLGIRTNTDQIIDRAYEVGRTPNLSSRVYQKMSTLLHLNSFEFKTGIDYDKGVVTEYIKEVNDRYEKPAKNALFSFENGKVTTFREHENGLKINSEQFVQEVDKNIQTFKKKPKTVTIQVTDTVVKPEITLSKANNMGIEELIGEGQSDYSGSTESRIHNLTLGTSKFNGAIIEKGKNFSFNQILGDVSSLTGYVPGYVILNGKTVLGDGGGVCQVSTTMFRALLNTGLPITERNNHAYRVKYYENDQPVGLDAAIYLPNVDLKAVNDTPAAILIQTQIDTENRIVYFKLYGKKDGRQVEVSKPILTDQAPAPPAVTQDDPTMRRGETKLIEHAIPGGRSTFNYKVTKNNQVTFEKKFSSWYRPWAQVTMVGTGDF